MADEIKPRWAPELADALVRAQRAVRTAAKDSKNTFHGYRYASAEAVIEVAKVALDTAGLALAPDGHTVTCDDSGQYTLHATHTLVHASGHCFSFDTALAIVPDKGRPLDKATLAARTEDLGYALRDLLLIPRGDAEDVSGRADDKPPPPAEDIAAKREAHIAKNIATIKGHKGATKANEAIDAAPLTDQVKARLRDQLAARVAWLEAQPKPAPATFASAYAEKFSAAKTQEDCLAIGLAAAQDWRLNAEEKMRIAELGKAKLATLPAARPPSLDEALADPTTGEVDDVPF